MIREKITLESGKQVWAYSLNQSERDLFYDMKKHFYSMHGRIQANYHNLIQYQKELVFLYELFHDRIKDLFEQELRQFDFIGKSFHQSDLWLKLPDNLKITKCFTVFDEVFTELLKEGLIENRGSGWFRFTKRAD